MWLYAIKSVKTERKQRISRANCFLLCCPRLPCLYPPFLWLLTICSQDKSRDDRTYGYCHNFFSKVVWEGEYLHYKRGMFISLKHDTVPRLNNLYTPKISVRWPIYIINSVDKTRYHKNIVNLLGRKRFFLLTWPDLTCDLPCNLTWPVTCVLDPPQRHSPEADFNKIYDKPAYKTKKMLLQTHNTYNKAYTPTTNY